MHFRSLVAVLAWVGPIAGQDAGDAAGCMLVSLVLSSHGHPVDLQPSFTRYVGVARFATQLLWDGPPALLPSAGAMAYIPMRVTSPDSDEGTFRWNGYRCHGGPIHDAAVHGNLDKVKALIEGKPDKLAIVKSKCTFTTDAGEEMGSHEGWAFEREGSAEAIHMGASRSHIDVVQYLLDARAELSAAVIIDGKPQFDVLHAAVSGEGCGGKFESVKHLLAAKAPVTVDAKGRSLLHVAFHTGNIDVIKLLRDEDSAAPPAQLVHQISHKSFTVPLEEESENTIEEHPLSLGIVGGKLKEEELSELAEVAAAVFVALDRHIFLVPYFRNAYP
eukprot:s4796_g1.t1